MSYVIELERASCHLAYVVAHAATMEDARAIIDAELGRDDDYEDVVIVAVHTIH
jgi:hypothetical protein